MRIAVVTESYLPQVNGVTNSVVRTTAELRSRGHDVIIIAPGTRESSSGGDSLVVRTAAIGLPGYREVKIGIATRLIDDTLAEFRPDVIHLASPVVLGAAALRTARDANIPTVAVYQTDLPRYAATYHLPFGKPAAWRWLRRIHNRADLTLAPTIPVAGELIRRGFRRVRVWGRGVDTELFHPSHQILGVRTALANPHELLAGYVGRLAADKEVRHLVHLHGLPNVRLVVVGDGPARAWLEKRLREAVFTGFLNGSQLSTMFATFDLLIHTSRFDTFGQVIQEALASGTPVLAPASGGPLDLVANGHNGVLWPAQQPARIADLTSWLVEDREALDYLAANARPSVEYRTWSVIVDELEDHYDSVAHRIRAVAA